MSLLVLSRLLLLICKAMKLIIYVTLIVLSTYGLAGCTGRIVHLENDQGTHLTCEVSTVSAMMTGVLVRAGSIDRCVRQHEAAGFKVTRED